MSTTDWAQVLDAADLIRSYDGEQPLASICRCFIPIRRMASRNPITARSYRARIRPRLSPTRSADKPSLLLGLWESQRLQNMVRKTASPN
jgi:hypothetical protein